VNDVDILEVVQEKHPELFLSHVVLLKKIDNGGKVTRYVVIRMNKILTKIRKETSIPLSENDDIP